MVPRQGAQGPAPRHLTRAARLLAACACASLWGACATFASSWLVRRDAPLTLLPNEGLVALSARGVRASLALCRDGDLAQCIELGPVSDDRSGVVVARVHEGRHCVRQIVFELGAGGGFVESFDPPQAPCVDVVPGVVNDVGVLEVDARATQTALVFVRSRFVARDDGAARVRAAYPHLARVPVRGAALAGGP